ncbi:hypothetical protein JCM13991_05720 [Thermodesulfovibrio hydrogeniphilus]
MSYLVRAMEIGTFGVVAFFLGHILGDLAWYFAVSVGVYKGKKFLDDILYKRIVFLCASILIIFSFYFIWAGIQKIKDI